MIKRNVVPLGSDDNADIGNEVPGASPDTLGSLSSPVRFLRLGGVWISGKTNTGSDVFQEIAGRGGSSWSVGKAVRGSGPNPTDSTMDDRGMNGGEEGTVASNDCGEPGMPFKYCAVSAA